MAGFSQTMDNEKYGIRWTTPQCVLTLKLIGLSLDLYDGQKKVFTYIPCILNVCCNPVNCFDDGVMGDGFDQCV